MRSPGVIYRRYRQLRKRILFERAARAKARLHENCVYGKDFSYKDHHGVERSVRACEYTGVCGNSFEICDKPSECSAFINKWSREDIEFQVESELSEFEVKREKYPEITVLEWVLDKDFFEAVRNPGFFARIILWMIMVLENLLRVFTRKKPL